MLDPLGGFNRIRELYISYLDTAFRVRRPALAERRRALLRTSGTLTTEPFLEAVPRYETSRFALEQLIGLEYDNPIGQPEIRSNSLSFPCGRWRRTRGTLGHAGYTARHSGDKYIDAWDNALPRDRVALV